MNLTRLSIQNFNTDFEQSNFIPLLNKTEIKSFTLEHKLDDVLTQETNTVYEKDFIFRLNNTETNKRIIERVLDINCDRNLEAEALGVAKYCKDYTLVFSLQDSLDLVLFSLCGVEPKLIRGISNYQRLSRGLLNVNFDLLGDFTFEELLNIDDKLDYYLNALFNEAGDYQEFLRLFYKRLTNKCYELVCLYTEKFRDYMLASDTKIIMSPRSKNITTIILSCNIPMNIEMEVISGYHLRLKTYKRKEYFNYVNDLHSVYDK
ncbi:hypothetical protein [Paraclostridium bifermentans]|uniref:hypothetical protein n=1 Tax=Paraclostridium bifermentans TaxID=1490 RepID=UPI00374F7488